MNNPTSKIKETYRARARRGNLFGSARRRAAARAQRPRLTNPRPFVITPHKHTRTRLDLL